MPRTPRKTTDLLSPPKSYSVVQPSSPSYSVTKPLSIRLVRTPLKELLAQGSPKRKRDSPPMLGLGDVTPDSKRLRRGSRPRTPIISYSIDLTPDKEDTENIPRRRDPSRRLSMTPSSLTNNTTSTRASSNRRRTQSDQKKPLQTLSPIRENGRLTPLKKNPAVRRLVQETSEPVTPRRNRRRILRAPSPSKENRRLFALAELAELEDDGSDDFVPLSSGDEEDKVKPSSNTTRRRKTTKPSTPAKTKKKPSSTTGGTPRRKSSVPLTPKAPSRKVPLPLDVSDIQEAQLRLHVSAVPDSLPCRDKEFEEILNFTESKVVEASGGCMYISGVPGTGKTATVREVIRTLQADEALPSFRFIEMNGMRLTEPNQAYVQIWRELSQGPKVTPDHAQSLLDQKFSAGSSSSNNNSTVVLLVDELDMLCTSRRQNVLYNLFEWPSRKNSNLVVLAIANTMDLPERVMLNRVSSRLGLTRLTFSPYTHQQLQEIVASRLSGLEIFDRDAVQLVARKVASLSGDARRALDICRRATEIAERRSGSLVSLSDVAEAHKEMFSSSKVLAIRSCSTYEKLFLTAILSEFHRTGIEETSFMSVWREMASLIHYEGKTMLPLALGLDMAYRLSSSKLIIAEHVSKGLGMKIQLHVSLDDVQFALRKDNNNS